MMFDLDSNKPAKAFHEIIKECFPEGDRTGRFEVVEAETLHWNKLRDSERKEMLKDVGLPSSFARDDWKNLDHRAKERLGKMINKTTKGEFALREKIEMYDDVDAKTVALYNKAKAKAVKTAADAKAAEGGDSGGDEEKKKKEPEVATEQEADTYRGKKPKKAKKTLELPGNSASELEESNMENERSNVNPFGSQDKLAADMVDILKGIRMQDVQNTTPAEFDSLAKDVAEKHRGSTNDLNTDIMDTLKTSNKVYSNSEVDAFKGMVNRELGKES